MAYSVTIINNWLDPKTGKPLEQSKIGHRDYATIPSIMEPTGSYVDTVAYANGYPNGSIKAGAEAEGTPNQWVPGAKPDGVTNAPPYTLSHTDSNDEVVPANLVYEKSIYATNVYGEIGSVGLPEYWAETLIPMGVSFAQIRISDVAVNSEKKNEVTFTVEDFTAAFYFLTLANQLKDNGFTIKVVEIKEEPTTPPVQG